MAVQVGTQAPNFKAQAYLAEIDQFKEISLEDYKGKWVCLYFYPMDFTFVYLTHAYLEFVRSPCCVLVLLFAAVEVPFFSYPACLID